MWHDFKSITSKTTVNRLCFKDDGNGFPTIYQNDNMKGSWFVKYTIYMGTIVYFMALPLIILKSLLGRAYHSLGESKGIAYIVINYCLLICLLFSTINPYLGLPLLLLCQYKLLKIDVRNYQFFKYINPRYSNMEVKVIIFSYLLVLAIGVVLGYLLITSGRVYPFLIYLILSHSLLRVLDLIFLSKMAYKQAAQSMSERSCYSIYSSEIYSSADDNFNALDEIFNEEAINSKITDDEQTSKKEEVTYLDDEIPLNLYEEQKMAKSSLEDIDNSVAESIINSKQKQSIDDILDLLEINDDPMKSDSSIDEDPLF